MTKAVTMNSVLSSVRSLMQQFSGKTQEFIDEIDNVHMVWLREIQQEANRMFSGDFNAEPELMPKTPSQKKNSRRKRVSLGRQEENQARQRFSKGRRSNLRGSSIKSLNRIAEEEAVPEASASDAGTSAQPKRTTRKNKQRKSEEVSQAPDGSCKDEEVENKKPELPEEEESKKDKLPHNADVEVDSPQSPPKIPSPEVIVSISPWDRQSAEHAMNPEPSSDRSAAKIPIAGMVQNSRRSSMRCSLKLRHSLAGLRHSMTQESVRRASRRSMLKRKVSRMMNSMCSNNDDEDTGLSNSVEEEGGDSVFDAVPAVTEDAAAAEQSKGTVETKSNQEVNPGSPIGRVTRSVAANSWKLAPPALFNAENTMSTPNRKIVVAEKQQSAHKCPLRSRQSTKRKVPDTVESPTKRFSPPKKSQSAVRPNMRSFLHTVHKNQPLMTPNTLSRSGVIKSFIKHTTPMKTDSKLSVSTVTKERNKLEALKKKQEQEEERMKKMEEEKKKRQDELKRKRDERLRRVFEAKVKEEQREEEKKKKFEQKMAQIDEKNDKRLAEEKAKKKVAVKRQEELEQQQQQQKKLEEEARRKKIQQVEEEKRQQELLAKKKAEEEEQQARRLAEARRALELKREQERERLAAAERERVEREKALALKLELERAAREKEKKELEERRKALEEKKKLEEQQRRAAEEKDTQEREAAAAKQTTTLLNQTVDIESSLMSTPAGKGGGLNVTIDIEKSPQSYSLTPKGGNKPLSLNSAEDYGMDQNSDDSTDDESAPRKPIPSWAQGHQLQQIIMKQYFNPPDLDSFFGPIESPRLENIFYKSKPRYFKRTSSAVWHSPPGGSQ